LAVSSPIYSLLMSNLPLLGQARGPGTWLMISSLCLALLVGRAFDSLKIDKRTLRWVTGLSLGLFLTTYLVYTLVFVNFPYVWQSLDTWVGSRLSGSEFHTLIRDQIIIKAILVDLLLALFCLMTSVWAWGQKRYWIILVCIMLDLTWQTRGLVLFGPGRVYRQEEAVKTVQPLLDNINTRQYRILTQNYNHSYTGFDAYFDAISLRAPFSDSYVTPSEMTTYNHAAQLKAGLTPDWNMPANLPIIHGYTTLLPLDIAKQFAHDKTELGINQLDEIKLDDPYLRNWSVGYYLEDSWFNLSWETRHLPVIKEFGRWQLKKLPQTYARFRFETYEPVQLDSFRETPNHLWLSLTNRKNYDTLVMADRYDRNWQATVNDRQVDVSRLDNIRKLPVEPEINTVEIWYAPRMFYLGLVFSGLTFFILVYRLEKRY